MIQVEYYGYMITDHTRAIALCDAISIDAVEFKYDDPEADDYNQHLSDELKLLFPEHVKGRALSGLWYLFHGLDVGYGSQAYYEPSGTGKLAKFGAIFRSDRGIVEPLVKIIEHLRSPVDVAVIWWTALEGELGQASGTVVIGPEGTAFHDVSDLREALDHHSAAGDAALTRLIDDRRLLLEMLSNTTPWADSWFPGQRDPSLAPL